MAFFQNAKIRNSIEKNELIIKKTESKSSDELDKIMGRKQDFYKGIPEHNYPYCFPKLCNCNRKTCTKIVNGQSEAIGIPLYVYVYPHRLARELVLYEIKRKFQPIKNPIIWLLGAHKYGTLYQLPKDLVIYIVSLMRNNFNESISDSLS